MTDHGLISQFESCSLAEKDFTHTNHVRVAFLYLQRFPVKEAISEFSISIRRLATSYGKAERYHETITQAYMYIIHEQMVMQTANYWQDFSSANRELLQNGKTVLEQYYRPETLTSDLARMKYV